MDITEDEARRIAIEWHSPAQEHIVRFSHGMPTDMMGLAKEALAEVDRSMDDDLGNSDLQGTLDLINLALWAINQVD